MYTKIKTDSEIKTMRESGHILAEILQLIKAEAVPGVSAKDLAGMVARELKAYGAESPTLGYHGFPDVLCVSFNDEVVHGIPSDRKIHEGDIVSLDLMVKYKGMITDSAVSIIADQPRDQKHVELLQWTERALYAGIETVQDGIHVGDISAAVEAVLHKGRYGIVRDLVGHGVGHQVHEDPNIPNYGRAGSGPVLESGMTIAIEPMATLGTDDVYVAADRWTILTRDHSWAAHFEHTVLITDDGYEILTQVD